jgi:hypothetical protein
MSHADLLISIGVNKSMRSYLYIYIVQLRFLIGKL